MMALQVYIDSRERQAVGPVGISWDSDGTAVFSCAFRRGITVEYWDRLTVHLDGHAVFDGRVRSVRLSDAGGTKAVQAADWKWWLGELPYAGRSLQVSRTARAMKVKYPYGGTASVSAGWVLPWTVGGMCQDILNGAYAGLGSPSDSLPALNDVIPDAVAQYFIFDRTNWSSETFATVETWHTGTTSAGSACPFAALTLKPWGLTLEGESVRTAMDAAIGRYYPGYRWYWDPDTQRIVVTNSYSATPRAYRVGRDLRVYVDDLEPTMSQCYTRVIVEGSSAARVELPAGYVTGGFVAPGQVTPHQGASALYRDGGGSIVEVNITTTRRNGIDDESQRVVETSESTGWTYAYPGSTLPSPNPQVYVDEQGYYWKDTRWRYDSGWGGTAYTAGGLKRTLVLMDDTLGDKVYCTATDGTEATVDRSSEGTALGAAVWAMLKDTRYTGTLTVKQSPRQFNPALRVTVENHPDLGDVTFAPVGAMWDFATNLMTYRLGDWKYNPVEQLKLTNELNWVDPPGKKVQKRKVVVRK